MVSQLLIQIENTFSVTYGRIFVWLKVVRQPPSGGKGRLGGVGDGDEQSDQRNENHEAISTHTGGDDEQFNLSKISSRAKRLGRAVALLNPLATLGLRQSASADTYGAAKRGELVETSEDSKPSRFSESSDLI